MFFKQGTSPQKGNNNGSIFGKQQSPVLSSPPVLKPPPPSPQLAPPPPIQAHLNMQQLPFQQIQPQQIQANVPATLPSQVSNPIFGGSPTPGLANPSQSIFNSANKAPTTNIFKPQINNTIIAANNGTLLTNGQASTSSPQSGINLFNIGQTSQNNTLPNQLPQSVNLSTQLAMNSSNKPTFSQNVGFPTNSFNQPASFFNLNFASINPSNSACSPLSQVAVNQMTAMPLQNQKSIIQSIQPDYVKQLLAHYQNRIGYLKYNHFYISNDNPLRNEKIVTVATALNIKPQILQVKTMFRHNITQKIEKLKQHDKEMSVLSAHLHDKVFNKLQRYKEKLISTITEAKMVEEMKKEVQWIQREIQSFFKPLFNAYQLKRGFQFPDPNNFCVQLSQKVLKEFMSLNNRMDQILAKEMQEDQDINEGDVIMQLIEYYQNVAITLKEHTEKYNKIKMQVLRKHQHGNAKEVSRKMSEKARSIMVKDMEAYEVVKEIERVLQKKERKDNWL